MYITCVLFKLIVALGIIPLFFWNRFCYMNLRYIIKHYKKHKHKSFYLIWNTIIGFLIFLFGGLFFTLSTLFFIILYVGSSCEFLIMNDYIIDPPNLDSSYNNVFFPKF